jgi:histidinol-phosphate/aromatic aminotransferase/cobyric acid decarboxylase-like protein
MVYLRTQLHRIVNYPDPEAHELIRKIALHHGVNVGNVFVINDSTQAFYLLAYYFA